MDLVDAGRHLKRWVMLSKPNDFACGAAAAEAAGASSATPSASASTRVQRCMGRTPGESRDTARGSAPRGETGPARAGYLQASPYCRLPITSQPLEKTSPSLAPGAGVLRVLLHDRAVAQRDLLAREGSVGALAERRDLHVGEAVAQGGRLARCGRPRDAQACEREGLHGGRAEHQRGRRSVDLLRRDELRERRLALHLLGAHLHRVLHGELERVELDLLVEAGHRGLAGHARELEEQLGRRRRPARPRSAAAMERASRPARGPRGRLLTRAAKRAAREVVSMRQSLRLSHPAHIGQPPVLEA